MTKLELKKKANLERHKIIKIRNKKRIESFKQSKKRVNNRLRLVDNNPGLTKQEFTKEVDINNIVKRYGIGNLPHQTDIGRFLDLSKEVNYGDALSNISELNDIFLTIDPVVRFKFENSPAKLVEFLHNPVNKKEAQELGLLPKDVVKQTQNQKPSHKPEKAPSEPVETSTGGSGDNT